MRIHLRSPSETCGNSLDVIDRSFYNIGIAPTCARLMIMDFKYNEILIFLTLINHSQINVKQTGYCCQFCDKFHNGGYTLGELGKFRKRIFPKASSGISLDELQILKVFTNPFPHPLSVNGSHSTQPIVSTVGGSEA